MTPILIHIQPFDTAANARVDVRIGSALEAEAYGLNSLSWSPAINDRPQMSIEIMSTDLSGRVQVGRTRFSLSLANAGIGQTRTLKWGGAPVKIYSAKVLAWPAVTEFDGEIVDHSYDIDTGLLSVTAEVSTSLIEKPLLTLEFDGSTGAGGDAAKRGTLKPAGFGSCENIPPVWFDSARNIGMIDGYGNCTAITKLMEGASDMGASVGNYATYAALAAAIDSKAIAPGRWGTCLAEGLVGLGAPPVGVIGVNATFGSNRLGAMMSRILTNHAGVATGQIDSASFTALDTALNYPAHYWTDQQIECKTLLEMMARSANATLIMSFQRKVSISRAVSSAAVATLDRSGGQTPRCIDWKILSPMKPVWRVKARAARPAQVLDFDQVNYVDTIIDRGAYSSTTVYRAGNLVWMSDKSSWLYTNATATSGNAPPTYPATSNAYWQNLAPPANAANITYASGATLESLKPAEIGANVTETRTAAAISNQAWAATNGSQPAVDNNYVVLGDKNRVPFSQFETATASAWYVWGQSGISSPSISYSTIAGIRTLTFSATSSANGSFGSVRSARFPVSPGETLSCQIRMSTNGITTESMTLKYFDASGYTIAAQPGVVPLAGISTPSQYQFQGVTAAPSNAVSAEVEVFFTATASGAMSATMSQPMVTGAKVGQIVFPAFTSGPNAFDAADVTGSNTAAAVSGQTAWATYGGDSPSTYQLRVQYIDTSGYLSGVDRILNRRMTLLKRADGVTDLTEAMAITSLGTAAAISGQTAWATYGSRSPGYLDTLSKPSANTLYNGGFTQDWKGWNSGGLNLIKDWRGNIVEAPSGTGGTFVAESSVPINVANGAAVTLSAVFTGSATSAAFYFVDIHWVNGGNGAHLDYSSNTANGCILINETATKKLAYQAMTAPSATDGSGFVRGYVRLVSICDVAYTSGTRWLEQIKVEIGSTPTPFSDEATDGANLSNATGRIPDSRQLNSSNNFGLRALSETPTFSQTNAGSSVTLDLGSNGKLYSDWGTTITLPSATITGLAYSTTYYIWRNMPSPDGAGSSYGYSSTLTDALGVGKVYLGYVTTMSSGGTGGGGGGYGGGNCVVVEALMPIFIDGVAEAADVMPGYVLTVLNEDLTGTSSIKCTDATIAENDCVTLETTSGITLTLALNTPMTLPGGLWEVAANMTDKPVAVLDHGHFRWETVRKVVYAGLREVANISCGNATFAAGDQRDRFIFSHNTLAKP